MNPCAGILLNSTLSQGPAWTRMNYIFSTLIGWAVIGDIAATCRSTGDHAGESKNQRDGKNFLHFFLLRPWGGVLYKFILNDQQFYNVFNLYSIAFLNEFVNTRALYFTKNKLKYMYETP